MKRAYSYVRFSTPEQSKGDSFRRQTEFSKLYAEKHGLVMDDSLSLQDLGVSAFRGANVRDGALAGFLEAVKSGKVPKGSTLIVESLDRLSRDQIRPALRLLMDLLDSGIHLVTIKPEREYTPEDQDPLTLIEPLIYFSRAHEESQTKSGRIADSWDARRRKAANDNNPMTTVCPAWLEYQDGKFVQKKEAVAAIRKIFKLAREGLGTFKIAKTLTDDGIQSFSKSGSWNTAYVRLILTDRRVMGEYQPKVIHRGGKATERGPSLPAYYPQVVTEQEFYAVMGCVKGRKKTGGRGGVDHENLLTGLVFNARTGAKMYYEKNGRAKGALLADTSCYYGKSAGEGRSFRYRPLESTVLNILTNLKPSDLDEKADDSKERMAEVAGKLAEIKIKLERATERARTSQDFDVFLDLIAELKTDQKRYSGEYEILKSKTACADSESIGEVRSLVKMRQSSKSAQLARSLRAKIHSMIKEIWVFVEVVTRVRKVAHVQVFFQNGHSEYAVVEFPRPSEDAPPAKLKFVQVDLRTYLESKSPKM